MSFLRTTPSSFERCSEASCSSTSSTGGLSWRYRSLHHSRLPSSAPRHNALGEGRPAQSIRRAVLTPAREVAIVDAQLVNTHHVTTPRSPEELLAEVLSPVAEDMEQMRLNLKNVVGQKHPMLMAAAEQIFSAGQSRSFC